MPCRLVCELWNPQNETEALAFLKTNFAVSMFLLGNFAEHGPTLTDHPNSGDFQVLKRNGQVIAVFCLTRRGNLLVSGEPDQEVSLLVIEKSLSQRISIKGVLGPWALCRSLWSLFQEHGELTTCSLSTKEILYKLSQIPLTEQDPQVRFLRASDFQLWLPIRRAYEAEEGLKHEFTDEQLTVYFADQAARRDWWGYFENSALIATSALNSRALDVGQVGGVFTKPEFRGKGLSKRVMRQMMSDCASVHGLKRLVLFTGEKNLPAQRVYERLGFQRIGDFGIYFA